MESGTIARNAKAAKLSDVMLNELDYAARMGFQGELLYAGRKTEDALLTRGLITYTYDNTKFGSRLYNYRNPILTVAGWAVVCPEGRPADEGRMTLEEAWADAHPVAAPIKVQPLHTVDFATRLELASVGMDVLLSNVTDRPDESAPVVSAAIDEAAELLGTETPSPVAFVPNAVLKAAGDIIRVRGWVQGVLAEEDGRVCALGAIRAVGASPDDEDLAEGELIRRIYATPAWIGLSIAGWNDRFDRTKGDVLRLLS